MALHAGVPVVGSAHAILAEPIERSAKRVRLCSVTAPIGEAKLVALGPRPSGGWGRLHGLAAELLRLKVDILVFFVAFSKP
jgi:hypothetical protein